MAAAIDFMTTRQVSDLLGVESRQVRALADCGAIARVARGLFDRTSVERHLAERGTGLTRTWDEYTAWGAIALLSGAAAPMKNLGDSQTWRLRAQLLATTDAAELAVRLRERADVYNCSGHRSVISRIREDEDVILPGRTRLGLVRDDSFVDGYIHEDQVFDLVKRYRLEQAPRGAVTLRVTRMEHSHVAHLVQLNKTLAAVDAATSVDPRERGVGERVLTRRLDLFRENSAR